MAVEKRREETDESVPGDECPECGSELIGALNGSPDATAAAACSDCGFYQWADDYA